jgi:site-specific DNA recombinase
MQKRGWHQASGTTPSGVGVNATGCCLSCCYRDKDAFGDDGYSGAELDRPALNRLRQAAREGRVDVVLAYDPDRLSRKLYHQMILAEEFEKQGIKLEFITQGMGTSPEDRMFFNMRGLVA